MLFLWVRDVISSMGWVELARHKFASSLLRKISAGMCISFSLFKSNFHLILDFVTTFSGLMGVAKPLLSTHSSPFSLKMGQLATRLMP